jgi:hypothetical protein
LGASGVARGNKAFDVHANTYRVDADVVACFEFRQYQRNPDSSISYASGTAFLPDRGGRIHNWPQQNYDNGVRKNEDSGRFYKPAVRILKRLKNEMSDAGYQSTNGVPSFLVESMLFNVDPAKFQEVTWTKTLRALLSGMYDMLTSADVASQMVEVNDLKYLFRSKQPWTAESAKAFLADAWQYHHSI